MKKTTYVCDNCEEEHETMYQCKGCDKLLCEDCARDEHIIICQDIDLLELVYDEV